MADYKGRMAYTVDEACEQLSIGRTLFYELVQAGEIKTFKLRAKTLVAGTVLADFIDRKIKETA